MSRYRKTMLEALEEVRNESKQKPYISSSNGTWIVLDADGKEAYKSTNYTLAQAYFKKNYDTLNQQFTEGHSEKDFEPYPDWKLSPGGGMYPRFNHPQKGQIQVDRYGEWIHSKNGKTIAFYRNFYPKTNTTGGTSMKLTDYLKKINEEITEAKKGLFEEADHEISMARGELEAIADKATQLASMLQGKSDEGNPLEAWVQSKITKAKDYINSVSDYLTYNPDMKQNEELEEGRKTFKSQSNIGQSKYVVNFHDGKKKHNDGSDFFDMKIFNNKIDRDKFIQSLKQQGYIEEGFSSNLKQKAKEIAKKFANNMTGAVKEIEKLARGLSKDKEVYAALRQYNEDIELDEGGIKDIFTANQEGESAEEIAKRLKISLSTVKKILGEAIEEPKKENQDQSALSSIASKNKEIESLKGQVNLLKQKIENEKNKAIRPTPNPETGEVPLTIGLANKLLKDKQEKEAEEKKQKKISNELDQMANGVETKLESFTKRFLNHLRESDASDKAKAMGLDYMKFGRYGKDGKVTHKSVGGSLQALSKKDQEKDTSKTPKPKSPETKGDVKNVDTQQSSQQIKKDILSKLQKDKMVIDFDKELSNLASDLKNTGDEETANKIFSAMSAAEKGDSSPDALSKKDDMINALQGKPDLNSQYRKELNDMSKLYNDVEYTSKDIESFTKDSMNVVSKMSQLTSAGQTTTSDGTQIMRPDALKQLSISSKSMLNKIKELDIDADIKGKIENNLEWITTSTDSEGASVQARSTNTAIENIKFELKSLSKPTDKKDQPDQSKDTKKVDSGDNNFENLKDDVGNAVDDAGDAIRAFERKFDLDLDSEGLSDKFDKLTKLISKDKKINRDKVDELITDITNSVDEFEDRVGDEGTRTAKKKVEELIDDVYNSIEDIQDMLGAYERDNEDNEKKKNKKLGEEVHPHAKKMAKDGVSAEKIKKMHPEITDDELKKITEDTLKEFTSSMIKDLQKSYADLKGKTLSPEKATALSKHLDRLDLTQLRQLIKANIPFMSTLARNKVYRKTGKFEERRLYVESISALKKKADQTGMPYNILKQVYDRGMAAWKSGHRPGAGQVQWALARVNSFVTKSSGTWGGADKDLAAKVKGSK